MKSHHFLLPLLAVIWADVGVGQTFTTRFEGEENPLSESGRWINNSLDWTKIGKGNGIAWGTQAGTNSGIYKFDDSFAHLAGFPPDQEAWGEVHIPKPNPSCIQEVEILLRWTSTPHSATGYECFARCIENSSSYVQIVRWEGPLGKFTYLADLRGTNYGLKHGDLLKASVVGNVITVYINGVKKAQVTDNTYKTGNPGIGEFLACNGRQGFGSNRDFGFASFTARGLGGASAALVPWSTNQHPSDVAKSHVEKITTGTHRYTITQGGTMDGRNCRTPMGCGIAREGALLQTWESNRSVRMENVGQTDIVNPWLSNGRNQFRTVAEMVANATTPGMTDAEKANALWFQEIQYRHHAGGDNNELLDPVKVFNVYGYNTCGNDSITLATLWRQAGLKAAPARALGHCISQAYYDNRWHFYDGDMHSVYLLRDNETVASETDIARDHDLIKRTHSKGILMPDTWWDGQGMCAMYFYDGPIQGERGGKIETTMNMVLRPGEAIVWRWGQLEPMKHHGALYTMPTYPGLIYNGLWEYRPDFANELWRRGAASVENVTVGPEGLAAEEGQQGTVIWQVRAPYVLVGGRIEAEGTGARFFASADGKAWQAVSNQFDKVFSTVGPARYSYQLKCQLAGPARLRRLAIINDLQMAPLALPEMTVGENTFTYTDQSPQAGQARITHEWVERSASRAPLAPAAPVYPPDGGEADGTDIVFQWTPAQDPDGDTIKDYHFELSNRPDLRWPLSMCFYKLISRTADGSKVKGQEQASIKAQYSLTQPGLLTPDRQYYWHVRAMDSQGIWGPWSKTWSFTPRGPADPVNLTFDYNPATGRGVLHWAANAVGRSPVKYRIYGSDEKGFTIADRNFQSTVGITKEEMKAWNPWFPANFIAETAGTELEVVGQEVAWPAANKTYYRVVALDPRGKRSGPSDYVTAPRPIVYSRPETVAKVGQPYRYQAQANRSLGDLSARMKDNQQVSGYFDIEHPSFTLEKGPAWLKIDPATGVLSGTPDTAGQAEVSVTVSIDREVRKLDEKVLAWGNEKVLSTAAERVGKATQKFNIVVE